LDSYIQQFSHNTAEIVSTTTKIPSLHGSTSSNAATAQFCKRQRLWLRLGVNVDN